MSASAFSEKRSAPTALTTFSIGASMSALSISATSPVFCAMDISGRSPVVMPAFHLVLKSPQDMVSMLIVTSGLSFINESAAAWTASIRTPWVKQCQKVISPFKAPPLSDWPDCCEASLPPAGLSASLPPQPVRQVESSRAARDMEKNRFICLPSY